MATTHYSDARNAAQAIVNAHAVLALEPDASARLATHLAAIDPKATGPVSEAEIVYQAALWACRALDFVDTDAHCIAQAWQAQTARTGCFDARAWPQAPQDFGLQPWPRVNAFATCPKRLGLYAVLPDAAWVGRMARAGVPTVQLRFKSDDRQAIAREVQAAVDAVRGTGSLLFINDHWQAAIDAGAYGVHLGQEDLIDAPIETIRAAGLRLGLSSHGYAELLYADKFNPSYIALGAVFATTLKRMATPPQGCARLGRYVQLLRDYPTVAIGGIDLERLPAVLASGVGSVAIVRALVGADEPGAVVRGLLARMTGPDAATPAGS